MSIVVPDAPAPIPLPQGKVRRGLPSASSNDDTTRRWRLATFTGRLTELSGHRDTAVLTLAFRLVLEAQRQHGLVAWITSRDSAFYPPDAETRAIDLAALPVVRATTPRQAASSADFLLRSGAFRLIVLDLVDLEHKARGRRPRREPLPVPIQTRLLGLANKYDTALVCLTEKETDRPSLGSLVSLRAETRRGDRVSNGDRASERPLGQARYRLEAHVLKDKRCGPGWRHREVCDGPPGLY
ncbi:MAG: DNA recombination/repair protein RecA [Planctomycetota bacterium]|nr:DNA recombination/repair protein RecA [Planctomycetota bacterium]